jgi:hypothetical protein
VDDVVKKRNKRNRVGLVRTFLGWKSYLLDEKCLALGARRIGACTLLSGKKDVIPVFPYVSFHLFFFFSFGQGSQELRVGYTLARQQKLGAVNAFRRLVFC